MKSYASIDEMVLAILKTKPTYWDSKVGKRVYAVTVWVNATAGRAVATQRSENGWGIFGYVGDVSKKEMADAVFGFYGSHAWEWLPIDYMQ